MIRLDRLSAFAVFAEEGSFTAAARRLHLSQPALHVQVNQLADELGVPLYRRVGRGIELTAQGREVAAWARELDDRTRRFLDRLHGRDEHEPVALCAGEATYRYLLGPALRSYLRGSRPPLRLLVGDATRTVEQVASGVAHLGVTVPGAVPDGLQVQALASIPPVLAVPADHALAEADHIAPTDLADARLVVPPPGRPHRVRLEQFLAGVPWQPAAEVQGWDLTVQLVELGLGLAIVNGFVRLPRRLVGVPVRGLPSARYALVRRSELPPSPAVQHLAGLIARHTVAIDPSWSPSADS